jgi:hypothetical protein
MSTTPHSGTRYVRDAFVNAGYKEVSTRSVKAYNLESYPLMWGHFDAYHDAWMDKVEKIMPDTRHFVVVRDPIKTLCTHFHNNTRLKAEKHVRKNNIIVNNLDLYRRVQEGYIARFDPYIHRVEDPITSLGDWAGVELKDDGNRHSRPNDLREAVEARDLDKVADIINYGTLFEWFVTTHSANIAPLYRDQLGYDFWWYNG